MADPLVERLLAGDARSVARAISLVEEGSASAAPLLQAVFPHTGRATVIGLTGAPGSGKSSLLDRLVAVLRGENRRIGVVAVDPSSAFSGGAILGDRVRMQEHATDPDVFIRSMATRGHLGGLARATNDAIDLLDAAGYDPILVETVGVGQDEIEVVKTADLVAVVLIPGMGDDIQALKAGILEIADLFVINKADHPGADRLQSELDYALSLSGSADRNARPEVFRTIAVRDEGLQELRQGMERRLTATDARRRAERKRDRAEARLTALLTERLVQHVLDRGFTERALEKAIDDVAERRVDPYTVVQHLLDRLEVR